MKTFSFRCWMMIKSWKICTEGSSVLCQHLHTAVCVSVCYVTSGENRTLSWKSEGALNHYNTPTDYSWLKCQNIQLLTGQSWDDLRQQLTLRHVRVQHQVCCVFFCFSISSQNGNEVMEITESFLKNLHIHCQVLALISTKNTLDSLYFKLETKRAVQHSFPGVYEELHLHHILNKLQQEF